MINRYFLLIFIILLYNKCDVETNTVDPQASSSVREASENGLLVLVGKPLNERDTLVK
ncbi:hypothetical protein GCM10009120_35700 [Sphingobacterium siyangense subsp. cladoniae]